MTRFCDACGSPLDGEKTSTDFGPVVLRPDTRMLFWRSRAVQLRPTGCSILAMLMRSRGMVKKDRLYRELFRGRGMKNLDVQVHLLRNALKEAGMPLSITTTRRSTYNDEPGGYRLSLVDAD